MQRNMLSKAVQLNKEHRRRRHWLRAVSGMAAVVVFATTYALILPAITAERELVCGMEEHVHTAECRAETALLGCCAWEGHAHEASCYDHDGELCCGYADFALHTHDALCYDGVGGLLCSMEERQEHIHDKSCSSETANWLCGLAEGEGGHAHEESCFTEAELLCEMEETEDHAHDASCYSERELICGEEEQEGHLHSEECAGEILQELLCDKEEILYHLHEESCFDADGVLICTQLQVTEHRHGEECLAEHVHAESCYDGEEELICGELDLICGREEHTHTESCRPDDGLVELHFAVAEEYLPYIESSVEFPLTLTMPTETSIAENGGLPTVIVRAEKEEPLYQPKYYWVTEDGNPVDVNAVLSEDLALSLKLYRADDAEAEEMVTAVFTLGNEILQSATVRVGTPVSELLNETLLEAVTAKETGRVRFVGWSFTGEGGKEEKVKNGITEICDDTVYRAEFCEYAVLTLHDIGADGKEREGSPISVYAPLGGTLAELTDQCLPDKTPVSECVWVLSDGTVVDSAATPIEKDGELYTYSCELLLKLETAEEAENQEQEEVPEEETIKPLMLFAAKPASEPDEEVSDAAEGEAAAESISIVKRSGQPLTQEDFLVDGVNYADYSWEDENGNGVDADELVGTPLVANQILLLAARASYTINYDINISTRTTVFGTRPTVNGESSFTEIYDTGNGAYTLRVPGPAKYMVASGNKKTLYQFTGWKITRNSNIIAAGTNIDETWVKNNVDRRNGTTVTLTAQWTSVATTETVHFFVNLNCQVTDMDGNTEAPSSGDFTSSVYSSTMSVTGASMRNYWQGANLGGTQYVVMRAENADDTALTDQRIRQLVNGYDSTNVRYNGKSVWKTGYTGTKVFLLSDLPSDEHVLSVVRDMVKSGTVIRMDGVAIPEEKLTPDNFTVRWNVCKWDTNDGWHVDGILVGKQAYLTVKKTFLGDDAAVQQIKDGDFTITVHNTSSSTAKDQILTLNRAAAESGTNRKGYDAYDAASDTYTWHLALQQDNLYSIIENNYKSSDDAIQTSASYTVSNSPDAFNGWKIYSDRGISGIKAYAYFDDVEVDAYQTVALRNSYVKADTLSINKIDMATGNGLAGISYRLSAVGGTPLTLYQKPGASYYSTKDEDAADGFQRCEDSVITTDKNGAIFLKLDGGTFTLEEAFPTGYGGSSTITVTVGADDQGNIIFEDIRSSDSTIEVDGVLVDANTATLTIRNVSHPTSVTAKKVWAAGSATQPVTVELYRNGISLGGDYQAVLNAANGWEHTWEDLPLYADGAAAIYTLREMRIGSVNYDPSADADGYSGYMVSYDPLIYYRGDEAVDGPVWVDENGVTQYADNALLTVRNEEFRGQLMFMKVDGEGKPLAGAVFRLYRDAEQKQLLGEAVSDEYGRVIFENLMPDSYYVLKETDTPDGYIGADSLYRVRLSTQGGTTVVNTETNETVTAIVNYADEVEMQIYKINELEHPLAGAVFLLEQQVDGNWASIGTYESGSDGMISMGTLVSGSYRLTEQQSPDGYYPLAEPLEFTVQSGTVVPVNADEHWGISKNRETGVFTVRVINSTGYILPETGGVTDRVYTYGGLLLILTAATLFGYKQKRRKEENSS